MLLLIQDLVDERDHLTEMAHAIGDQAHEEQRQLNDREKAQLAEWETRCNELDKDIEQHSRVLEQERKWSGIKSKLDEVSRSRLPARRSGSAVEVSTPGQAFIESEAFKNYTGSGSTPNVHLPGVLDVRSWSSSGLDTRAAADPITLADLGAIIRPFLKEPPTPTWRTPLLDVVTVEPITVGSVEYFYFQPAIPTAAPVVAEGAAKPPVDVTLVLKAAALDTYAHWKAITRQALEDFPRIRRIVEDYLRGGVIRAMENALAVAINANTDIPAVPATAPGGLLGAIRVAQAMVQSNGFTPNAVLLNPNDWAALDVSMLYATLQGPVGMSAFWSLTPISSSQVPEGTAYVGDFRDGVTFFDRRVTEVRMTDSHLGFFIENKIVILAEARGYAAVTQPLALAKATGTIGTVPPPESIAQTRASGASGR